MLDDDDNGGGPAIRYPVMEAVKHAYGQFLGEMPVVLRIVTGWALAVSFLNVAMIALLGDNPTDQTLGTALIVLMIATGLAMAATAVAWHRHVLLGESVGALHIGLGGQTLAYFGVTIMIFLLLLAIAIPASFLLALILGGNGAAATGATVSLKLILPAMMLAIGLVLVVCRLMLVFPATAIQDKRVNFSASWRLTKGNGWKLAGGLFLCVLPASVLSRLGEELLTAIDAGSLIVVFASTLVMILFQFAAALIGVGYMSHAYQYFLPPPDWIRENAAD